MAEKSFDFGDSAMAAIKEMRAAFGSKSDADVVRKLISLGVFAAKKADANGILHIVGEDGKVLGIALREAPSQ